VRTALVPRVLAKRLVVRLVTRDTTDRKNQCDIIVN